jgi:hypothetical protein
MWQCLKASRTIMDEIESCALFDDVMARVYSTRSESTSHRHIHKKQNESILHQITALTSCGSPRDGGNSRRIVWSMLVLCAAVTDARTTRKSAVSAPPLCVESL